MKWRGRTWLQGPRAPRPGPVGQVARLSETLVAFARLFLRGCETAIAFAGEKWAFLVQFSGAEVSSVSMVPCWGASSGVVGFNVAMFLRAVRDICRPARPDVGASVKELALRAHNGQKLAFDGALGEFFADQQSWDPDGRVCCAAVLAAGSFCWRP